MSDSKRQVSSPVVSNSTKWKVLNSPIFLWFLSTVVIGIASYSYTIWNEKRQVRLDTVESISRLDLEIANRLSFFGEQITSDVEIEDALLILENPRESKFPTGVFTEFSDRSLRALLWELHNLVSSEEKQEIQIALDSTKRFKEIYLNTAEDPEILDRLFGSDDRPIDKSMPILSEEDGRSPGIVPPEPVKEQEEVTAKITDSTQNSSTAAPSLQPIEINLHVKIEHKIQVKVAKAAGEFEYTFAVFNLERWGKPFQELILKVESATALREGETR